MQTFSWPFGLYVFQVLQEATPFRCVTRCAAHVWATCVWEQSVALHQVGEVDAVQDQIYRVPVSVLLPQLYGF